MDTQEVTLKQIDDMKAACEDYIKVAEALDRLRTNEDFKLVFEEKYTKEYAIRTVGLLGDGSYNPYNNRKDSKEELYDFSLLLSSILNYQGFCLQQGVYKNIDNISEDVFRDNMIQHLISMYYIGENINKEAHLSGGRVEIGYKGIIAELKVEKIRN